MGKKTPQKLKSALKKIWWFLWEDNSIWSWAANVAIAFVIIKFMVYPLLGLMLGTTHPVVAVVSSSMEHSSAPVCIKYSEGSCDVYKESSFAICGFEITEKKSLSLDEYYSICGKWYIENAGITLSMFRDFRFRNGFNKGDIMVLAEAKEVEVGDIIVFYVESRPEPIIHRVVEVAEGSYTTKGDHNHDSAEFEKLIPKESVIGKAVLRVPLLGWIKVGFIGLLSIFTGG